MFVGENDIKKLQNNLGMVLFYRHCLVIAIDKEIMHEGKLVPKVQPRDTKTKDIIYISNYRP